MNSWFKIFNIEGGLSNWPSVKNMEVATKKDSSYHFSGRDRQNDQYCAFQHTLSGKGFIIYRGIKYSIPTGHSFICPVYDPDFSYGYPEDASEPWSFIYINLLNIDDLVQSLINKYSPVFQLPESSYSLQLLDSFRKSDEDTVLITQLEATNIAMNLLKELTQSKIEPNRPERILIRKAVAEIKDNLSQGMNVTELAKRLEISREHLTRVFQQELNKTPHRYISEQKILLACKLLKESSLSSKEIAYRVGDPSPAHFTTLFKKMLNMTPLQYRKSGDTPLYISQNHIDATMSNPRR